MQRKIQTAIALAALLASAHSVAQITFYDGEGFRGRAFTTAKPVDNFQRTGFNDRASSVVVDNGRWEVCEDARFNGKCVLLRRGSYDSLRSMGLDNTISSVRPVERRREQVTEVAPVMETANYEYRRRANERVFEAPVISARAVLGAASEKCWVERQQVAGTSGDRNVGGAIAGAVIGGVLGHQVGGGRGKDLATVGGAVAGGVIGSNVGRDSTPGTTRDVRRCENVQSGTPAYWDVTYRFKNQDHHVQMSADPGATVAVNANGVPRQ